MDKRSIEKSEENMSWLSGVRVVYAVWFDQLWYWREIRPYLTTAKPKSKLFISTAVVTLIINTLLFIASGLVFQSFDYDFDWQLIGLTVGAINLSLLVMSTYMMLPKKPEMHPLNQWSLPPLVITTTTGTFAMICAMQNIQLMGLAFGIVTGLSFSMSLGIVKLTPSTFKESLFSALLYGGCTAIILMTIPMIELNIVWIGITAVFSQTATQFIGGKWATRQLDSLELHDE